jgi:hypothetical protein
MLAKNVKQRVGQEHGDHRKQGKRRPIQGARCRRGSSRNKGHRPWHRHSNGFGKDNYADNDVSVMYDQREQVVHGVEAQD